MSPLGSSTHYEVLELSADADRDAVERAYRLALSTFGEGSLAVYSLLEEKEAAAMRERIEAAYQVLSDERLRRDYDAELAATAATETEPCSEPEPEGLDEPSPPVVGGEILDPGLPIDDFEHAGDDPWDGARLRRTRLNRGVEIERIAEVTKINPTYLRFIEDERFEDLPAPVYVRGFLTAYTRSIGVDPEAVVPGYMQRLEAARPPAPEPQRRWTR